jgi:CheY-like chemotaxis protein/signal transduction histidine kinase/methyl-accepting chemotaxis protein
MNNLDYNSASTWQKIKLSFKSWRYIGVGKSLLIWFLAISIIPLASISFINFLNAYHGLTIVAEKSLNTTSQLRVEYINTFFKEIVDFLEMNSRQKADIEFIKKLKQGFQDNEKDFKQFVDKGNWNEITAAHRDEFKDLAKKNGYYNIYYIDNEGNILFSLKEESDLGTNIFTGEFRLSGFAASCREAIDQQKTQFSDLELYNPSFRKLSGFFVQPVFDQSNTIVGLIALQVTMDRINQIIRQDAGYGETGQAYIVGKDRLLRSTMRFGSENEILMLEINNQKVKDWLFYLQHQNNPNMLKTAELDEEKVSTYDSDGKEKYVLGIYRNLTYLQNLGINWVLIEEIEHSEAFAYARKLSDIVKLSFIITILLVFFTSILVTRWFVNPIKQLSSWAKLVAIGHLDNKTIKAPNNEIGEMVDTYNRLVNSLQSYANVAKTMARGDYNEVVEIRSENDTLGKSMNQMVESFRQVVEQANRIAKGDYSITLEPRSDKDTLNIALIAMTHTLEENAIENKNQDWLKTGINKLDSGLSGQNDLQSLSGKIITFISKYLEAQIGIIYILDEGKNCFNLAGTYAVDKELNKLPETVLPGQGLIGQTAIDKKLQIISLPKDNHLKVHFADKESPIQHYLLYPLIFDNKTIGVIEIGSIHAFSELNKQYLELAGNNIAIAIQTVSSSEKVKRLLVQTQEQANELAIQQEELRQANDELQEQTSALRISEEHLQTQQEELKVTNEELEERTKALEIQRDAINQKNKELEIARKEIEQKANDLEQASRYKSEFLANMSHELRTPLNSILVLSQLLGDNKKQHLDPKELEYAKTINGSGTDLLELINEILDLSKVESGKIDLHIENVYFDDLANFIQKSFSVVADKKGLELFFNIGTKLPGKIRSDVQRVYQIIKNLYSNALKFTHQGSVTLNVYRPEPGTIFLNTSLNYQKVIAFAVSDTGIGISSDKLQLIFEAFQQADGTTSRKYGGTGLGLSISKAFTTLLGGELKVESNEGQGTTFTLFLPEDLVIPDEISTEPTNIGTISNSGTDEKEVKKDKETHTKKHNKPNDTPVLADAIDDRESLVEGDRILLVIEDDRNFSRLLYDLAHEHKFKCLIASDGESGLHFADFYVPSAIILDIGLPGIDGYEVIDRLKKNNRTRHIPVHFVSASDKTNETMKKGAIGFLHKPVSKESLEEAFLKIEDIVLNPMKKLLIVEDEDLMRKSIRGLMAGDHINIVEVESGEDAIERLKTEKFDCMILDLGLKNMSGFELLEMIKKDDRMNSLPVVVYTARDLSKEEDLKLQRFADSIILKGARSFERLLSETTLFLHQIESKLSEKKQEMLRKLHNHEDVLSGKTIMIVDDDMRNVFALSSVLESYNVSIVIGKNGREGIEKLKANPQIDLIMMDIMMPEMDGYEAMRLIRSEAKYKKLPIIALTAKAMKDDREKCLAAGANEYLTKPVDSAKLISLLRVWLYQ